MSILFLLTLLLHTAGSPPGDSEYVRVSASVSPAVVAPGDSLTILIRFEPADDIHITMDPQALIEPDSSAPMHPVGSTVVTADDRSGYLRTAVPIRRTLVAVKGATPGDHQITGHTTYFYCSDAEGWCRRSRQPFSLRVTIVEHH